MRSILSHNAGENCSLLHMSLVSCFVQYSNTSGVRLIPTFDSKSHCTSGLRVPLSTCMQERGILPKIAQRFKIKTPIIAIVKNNGLHASMFTAVGDIVTIVRGPLDGVRLVEVTWHNKTALMFTMELREHAELIEGDPS